MKTAPACDWCVWCWLRYSTTGRLARLAVIILASAYVAEQSGVAS